MIKLRILIFLLLFCFLHKCKILYAVNTKPATKTVCSNSACRNAGAMKEGIPGPGPSAQNFNIPVGSTMYIWNGKGIKLSGNLIERDTYPINERGEYGFVVVETEGKIYTANLTSQTDLFNGDVRRIKSAISNTASYSCRITRPGPTDLRASLGNQVIRSHRRVIFHGPRGQILSQGLLEYPTKERPVWIIKQTEYQDLNSRILGTGPSDSFDVPGGSTLYIWNERGIKLSGNLIRRDDYPVNVTGEYGFVVVQSERKTLTASLTSQTDGFNGDVTKIKAAITKTVSYACRITRPPATDLRAALKFQVIPLRRRVIFYGPEGRIISQGLLEHATKERPKWILKQTEASGSGC